MGSLSNCRFYENQFPQVDDLVMVQVRQIAEMGAYVKLLEYDNIEGMILLSELSRRRIRSINKLIRVGRNEVVVVLRVDQEKGMASLLSEYMLTKDTLTFQNVGCHLKMLRNVKNDSINQKQFILSCVTSQKRQKFLWKNYIQPSDGHYIKNTDMLTMPLKSPSRILLACTLSLITVNPRMYSLD